MASITDCVGTPAHEIPCTDLSNDTETTIGALADGKIAVLDFWTTRCTRCPMAIGKLNLKAGLPIYKDKVVFFTVNCDDAEFAKETAEDEEWDNLTNVFITLEVKEAIKAKWGLKTVPHYTMIDASGVIVQNASMDSATKFDFDALEAAARAFVPGAARPAGVSPLQLHEEGESDSSFAASPLKEPTESGNAAELASAERALRAAKLSDGGGGTEGSAAAAGGSPPEGLEELLEANEKLRARIAEISAQLVDEGPESPGYGPNPLCDAADVESEPLLMENPSRFVIFPITEQSIWSMYKNVEATFWNTEEIDVSKDGAHFAALAPPERAFFEALLPSLCEVNDAVQANLLHRFTQEIQATEARFFFGNEISMLGMHGEMYCTLLEQLCPQPAQLLAKQVQAQAMPCLQAKLGWCEQWKNSSAPLGHRFVGFAAVQSIMCAGAAAAVGWMSERKMMPGLVSAAAHIQKDLGKYVEFLSLLHGMLKKQTPDADIERIVKDAVKIEKEFMLASGLDCTAIGLDAAQMSAYIEWTADTLLQALGKRKVYGVTNPYDWASASSPRAAGATQAALAKTTSTMVREDPADSVLTFGLDDDDF